MCDVTEGSLDSSKGTQPLLSYLSLTPQHVSSDEGVDEDDKTSPCFSTSFRGSTPGDRMKNMGVAGPDSSKDTEKSMDLPITYLLPSFSSTKSLQRKEKKKSSSLSLTNKLENFKERKLNKKKKELHSCFKTPGKCSRDFKQFPKLIYSFKLRELKMIVQNDKDCVDERFTTSWKILHGLRRQGAGSGPKVLITTDYTRSAQIIIWSSPDGVGHAVRSQSSHHAQFLQWVFVLPLLRELLSFWNSRLQELLPQFGGTFNVSVQVSELLHGGQGLRVFRRQTQTSWTFFIYLDIQEWEKKKKCLKLILIFKIKWKYFKTFLTRGCTWTTKCRAISFYRPINSVNKHWTVGAPVNQSQSRDSSSPVRSV